MVQDKIRTGQSVCLDVAAGRVFRLRKSVMTTARLVNDRLKDPAQNPNGYRYIPVMVTYTYAPGVEWSPEHVSKALRAMQEWAKRKLGQRIPYLWVMELTKAGVPHYHVIVWMPARWRMPKHDLRGWWPHGHTRVERVRNAVGYVAKYASKFASKDAAFPAGARIHGSGGLTQREKAIVAWWKLPKDLRTGDEGSCQWRRAPGGGWYNIQTLERRSSEWKITMFSPGGKYALIEKIDPDPEGEAMRMHFGWKRAEELKLVKETGVIHLRPPIAIPAHVVEMVQQIAKERAVEQSIALGAALETDRLDALLALCRLAGVSLAS